MRAIVLGRFTRRPVEVMGKPRLSASFETIKPDACTLPPTRSFVPGTLFRGGTWALNQCHPDANVVAFQIMQKRLPTELISPIVARVVAEHLDDLIAGSRALLPKVSPVEEESTQPLDSKVSRELVECSRCRLTEMMPGPGLHEPFRRSYQIAPRRIVPDSQSHSEGSQRVCRCRV